MKLSAIKLPQEAGVSSVLCFLRTRVVKSRGRTLAVRLISNTCTPAQSFRYLSGQSCRSISTVQTIMQTHAESLRSCSRCEGCDLCSFDCGIVVGAHRGWLAADLLRFSHRLHTFAYLKKVLELRDFFFYFLHHLDIRIVFAVGNVRLHENVNG